ncbi:MAG TPA: peptidoglycan DD-metalloendopeptidase family protein [Gaiellaceae bacterium]|nr:peptidoglycan DD-metalloendopeptidase family protein [Gaiellaceae bacterium]
MRIRPAALLAVTLALIAPAAARAVGDADVAALQVGLAAHDLYAGDVDGYAGPLTIAGLGRLSGATTPVSPQTRDALGDFGTHPLGSRPLIMGTTGWDVAALQFLLAWHGFPSGTLDGIFGARTKAALLGFQRWSGIEPIAIAGPQTLAALHEPPPLSPLALSPPIDATPTDDFGPRGSRFHTGIDFPAPLGTPVVAARDGVVTAIGPLPGYGTVVELQHEQSVSTLYAHLSRALVEPGRRVTRGTPVGLVGATGDATGPHLHFEVRVRGAPVDPAPALGD